MEDTPVARGSLVSPGCALVERLASHGPTPCIEDDDEDDAGAGEDPGDDEEVKHEEKAGNNGGVRDVAPATGGTDGGEVLSAG